jgi:hypothetical protein
MSCKNTEGTILNIEDVSLYDRSEDNMPEMAEKLFNSLIAEGTGGSSEEHN